MTDARRAALRIIGRVLRSGAYTNVVTPHEVAALEPRDRRFAQFLAYGTLRRIGRLDRVIDGYSTRPTIEPVVRDVLRLGAFELLVASTPPHAAIDSAVSASRELGYGRATGFVNAVLRSIGRHGEPDPTESGIPDWLAEALTPHWGADEVAAFASASMDDAPRTLRRRPGAEAHGAPPVAGIPDTLLAGEDIPAGHVVQDPAAVAVGWAAAPSVGDRVLDMAAAPGGKALHLHDQLAGDGLILADRHSRRLRAAHRRLVAAGCDAPWVVADGRSVPFGDDQFDITLLDAPCTGLGTLRRRPEIKYRVGPADVARLVTLQRAMLAEAVRVTRPGGRAVYAVCTVTPQETIDVVAEHASRPPEGLPGRAWGTGWLLAPHLGPTDGMFIAIIDA